MKLITDGRKALFAGVALVACLGFAFNAQAQTCVVTNWDGGQTNLANADAGVQGSSNRRYGGPCGLRVAVDGTNRFVSDSLASAETTYIARFYAFLDNAGSSPMILFAGDDGTDDVLQVWYNFPTTGDLTLRVFDNGGSTTDLTEDAAMVGTGWHSIELVWESAASANIAFSVDGMADLTATVATDTIAGVQNAHLGNVDGAAGSGNSIDFDDFDSRRVNRPGRLLVADSNNDDTVNIFDVQATGAEVIGGADAAGQPDCNEDGTIDIFDVQCTGAIVTGS